MKSLPREIQDKIVLQLNFEKVISLKNDYVANNIYNPRIHTWKWATGKGDLHVVKWLYENRKEGCTKDAMYRAEMNRHIHVVNWLRENVIN